MSSPYSRYKNEQLKREAIKIYDDCYNVELTSEEIRKNIHEKLKIIAEKSVFLSKKI
jgi:hypothetical protein